MKRKILVLSMVVALLSVLVVPTTVLALETTTVTGTIPAVVVTILAPSEISLSTLPYNASTAQQVVVTAVTPGSATAADLRGKSYELTVTGSSAMLKFVAVELTNALMIATGDDGKELGDVSAAAVLESGAYSDPGAVVVALTGSSQVIATGITTTPTALALTAFQQIASGKSQPAGDYTLTLTYASTVTE